MTDDNAHAPRPDTEQRIIKAAEREFMSKGFAGARTTTIAEAAGVTHAMLHYYFRTKEKLFDRIVSGKISTLRELLTSISDTDDMSLEDLVRHLIWKHLDFIAANPDLPRFIIAELHSDSQRSATILEKIRSYAPAVVSGLQRKIDRAADNGECRHINAVNLLLDIASLNIFPYVATPIINAISDNCMDDSAEFLSRRKEENLDIIMRKLKP